MEERGDAVRSDHECWTQSVGFICVHALSQARCNIVGGADNPTFTASFIASSHHLRYVLPVKVESFWRESSWYVHLLELSTLVPEDSLRDLTAVSDPGSAQVQHLLHVLGPEEHAAVQCNVLTCKQTSQLLYPFKALLPLHQLVTASLEIDVLSFGNLNWYQLGRTTMWGSLKYWRTPLDVLPSFRLSW